VGATRGKGFDFYRISVVGGNIVFRERTSAKMRERADSERNKSSVEWTSEWNQLGKFITRFQPKGGKDNRGV